MKNRISLPVCSLAWFDEALLLL